jgi:hypothetical protein
MEPDGALHVVEAAAAGGEWAPPEVSGGDGPMTLAVYQSLARPANLISVFDRAHPVLAPSAVDLRTLAVLEQRDPLALLKYARATATFREQTFLHAPTTLAAYALYRDHGYGYYVSDHGAPPFLTADVAAGARLREVARTMERAGERATYAELSAWDEPGFYNAKHLPLDVKPVTTTALLPPFRAIQDADQEVVMDDIAADFRAAGNVRPGPLVGSARIEILNTAVAALFARLEKEAAELASGGLLEDLLARYEALIRETIVHRLIVSRRPADAPRESHTVRAQREIQVRLNAAGALRFVIEYIVARPPAGSAPLTLARLDRLQAIAGEIIHIASLSDVLKLGIDDFPLTLLPTGRLSFNNAALRTLGMGYATTFAATEMLRVGRAARGAVSTASVSDDYLTEILNEAIEAEFGVSLARLRRFFAALVDVATCANDAWLLITTRAELLVALTGHGIDVETTDRLIDRFSLHPRAEFLNAPGVPRHEFYPWRVNRARSHRRRPLAVRVSENGADEILYGARHVLATWRDLLDQFVTGSYPAVTRELEQAKGKITNVRGAGFNALIADLARSIPGSVVEVGVKKIGKFRVPGDFDVLLAIPARRRLFALECKDIAPAVDVFAQADELKTLVTGDPSRGKRSFVDKQRERIEWLKAHLADALTHLKVASSGRWTVRGAIITSNVVPMAFRKTAVPILSAEELRQRITEFGAELRLQ